MFPEHLTIAEQLLAGPRGRRFLLEYAQASELTRNPVRADTSLGAALAQAMFNPQAEAHNKQSSFGWVTPKPDVTLVPLDDVVARLNAVELLEPTPRLLRTVLAETVGNARYWQEPDEVDLLAARPEMRPGLQLIAQHIADSPESAWWSTPVVTSAQYSVPWEQGHFTVSPAEISNVLRVNRENLTSEEHRAQRDRDPDPTANFSGDWWSTPPKSLPATTRLLFDGSPAGLWFAEDSPGWEQAVSNRLIVLNEPTVFEVQHASDWAQLCARFPQEVTAQKRHDWYRTTGYTGPWVIPDWVQVAEHYDGVHLQVGAYLGAAGTAIAVSDAGAASVIAGWNPDETYWLTSDIGYGHEPTAWVCDDDGPHLTWQPGHRIEPEW